MNLKIIGRRLLNAAANPLGFSVVPTRQLQGFDGLMKFFGMSVVWGVWGEKDYIKEGYMKNSTVYSIINKIATTAAIAPFKVYRVKDKKKFKQYKAWTGTNATKESLQKAMMIKALVYEEDTSHPFNEFIEKPNPYQGGKEFIINCIGFKLLTGNRFLLKNKYDMGADEGKVFSVFNLPPQSMGVVSDGTLFGVKEYILQVGRPITIPNARQFWHHSHGNKLFFGLLDIVIRQVFVRKQNIWYLI